MVVDLLAVVAASSVHPAERWIPGSVGLLLTGIPLVLLMRELARGYATYGWKSAPGKVVASRKVIRWPSHRIKNAFAEITYTYTVDGESRTGQRIRYGHGIEAGQGTADDLLRRFPTGAEIQVRYRGKESTLLPGPSRWLYLYLPLVAFIFGGILYGLMTGT